MYFPFLYVLRYQDIYEIKHVSINVYLYITYTRLNGHVNLHFWDFLYMQVWQYQYLEKRAIDVVYLK